MKNTIRKFLLIASLFMISFSAYATGKTMYVSEKTVVVKASASVFAKQTHTLQYATAVEVLGTKGSFTKIRVIDNQKITGWVKSSYLTSKKLSSVSKITTDAEDIALAGKGSINEVSTDEEQNKESKIIDAK